jgi:flagella basal body P-ring formation protein FlgA
MAFLAGGFALPLSANEFVLSETSPATVAGSSTNAAVSALRPGRPFTEQDLLRLLTATLQREYVKDDGELELRLTQPWKTRTLPDEPLTLKVLDMPTLGVTPVFIVRFELRTPREVLGTWQAALKAWIWRGIWVARSPLDRGESLADAAVQRERRDVLLLHEPLADFSPGDTTLELSESLPAGAPLLARSVRPRPVVHRGQTANALLQDGALSITMKVEVLEDAAPGQMVRVRNAQSRRDIRGKVINEHTILVSL